MRILVCEDDQAIRRIIEITLESRGHEVILCENAGDSIKAFDDSIRDLKPFDLIIADVNLPGPSGYSLA